MHYLVHPNEKAKLVRCTKGDLRYDSSTFNKWLAMDLTAENRRMLYVPEGFAHGFQTIEDDSEIFYQMPGFTTQNMQGSSDGMTLYLRISGEKKTQLSQLEINSIRT
jgi:dTDP-4-dehydrorhamnose 3,5-epimerase-like enzyme